MPDGSIRSPNAAWVSNKALRRLTAQQRKEFLPLRPEFLVEVRSPSDDLQEARDKVQTWIRNGAHLALLIDGDARTVYIYRKGQPMKTHPRRLPGASNLGKAAGGSRVSERDPRLRE